MSTPVVQGVPVDPSYNARAHGAPVELHEIEMGQPGPPVAQAHVVGVPVLAGRIRQVEPIARQRYQRAEDAYRRRTRAVRPAAPKSRTGLRLLSLWVLAYSLTQWVAPFIISPKETVPALPAYLIPFVLVGFFATLFVGETCDSFCCWGLGWVTGAAGTASLCLSIIASNADFRTGLSLSNYTGPFDLDAYYLTDGYVVDSMQKFGTQDERSCRENNRDCQTVRHEWYMAPVVASSACVGTGGELLCDVAFMVLRSDGQPLDANLSLPSICGVHYSGGLCAFASAYSCGGNDLTSALSSCGTRQTCYNISAAHQINSSLCDNRYFEIGDHTAVASPLLLTGTMILLASSLCHLYIACRLLNTTS
ncbi:hypothetical protein AB1Y20_007086 [Prymnesium parvum]|uniref:Membrane-associated protein n=1 Tax=Prymnesium parvum TaxID=97485 RepID=A0AB34J3J7_PRYPA